MYWEARIHIHQQKHTLAEPCFFTYKNVNGLFITNHITDALSDLNWTAVHPLTYTHIHYIAKSIGTPF